MATTEQTRPEPVRGATAAPPPAPNVASPSPAPAPTVAAFRTGEGEDDGLIAQLAFARAMERAERGAPPEAAQALRAQALADLSAFAFRYLHNRVEEVRRDAVATQLGQLGRPPGFLRLVAANLVALLLVAVAGSWLVGHPETLSRLIWR